MLKEIPETLMPCVFDPIQHDLRTDMGTDIFDISVTLETLENNGVSQL